MWARKCRNQHRAAIAVVAGIDDVLEAGREVDPAPRVHGVIGFQDIFAAVVEAAVAEKKSEAACREIILVILLDGIADEGEAGAILFAMPPSAVRAHSFGESLIHFRVGEGFGLCRCPSRSGRRR